ncbi:MAG: DUF1294 domain-containing protein [Muribaculaceae bacterium]|nr:DUF1294 domain-containing protein [Muribaculaceae bacterium]
MVIYIIIINIITFSAFAIDKHKARRNQWRISENTLLLLATIGGSIGAYTAMKTFRHKTRHKKFTIIIPLLIIAHIALVIYTKVNL